MIDTGMVESGKTIHNTERLRFHLTLNVGPEN